MKNLKQSFLLILLIVGFNSFAQKSLKTGTINYKMTSDTPEMAMLGEVDFNFFFGQNQISFDMNMMGGLINMKVITDVNDEKNTKLGMDMMGQKFEITDAGSDPSSTKSVDISNLENVASITYDKKSTKDILGYKCIKADVLYNDGKSAIFYLTNKINPIQKQTTKVKLDGYPLEMIINQNDEVSLKIVAVSVSPELPKGWNILPEGYEKMTMKEFEEKIKQQ